MQSIESLESRHLLSTAPSITVTSKGTLLIAGTSSADHVTITRTNNNDPNSALDIVITGGSANTSVHAREKVSEFQRIDIDLGAGADSVTFDIPGKLKQRTTILGGAGDDTLEAVLPGPAVLSGGAGNDVLFSQVTTINATAGRNSAVVTQTLDAKNKTGPETLLGEDGNDTLFADSNDSVNGGAGTDVAAVQMENLTSNDQARADALAAVFYGRIDTKHVEKFEGQVGGSTQGNLPAPPSNPGLFAPSPSTPGNPNPNPLDPNPPPSPIDAPPPSPFDGLMGP
jgi:hypothetical protein